MYKKWGNNSSERVSEYSVRQHNNQTISLLIRSRKIRHHGFPLLMSPDPTLGICEPDLKLMVSNGLLSTSEAIIRWIRDQSEEYELGTETILLSRHSSPDKYEGAFG